MAITETTTESWGSRLGGSVKGVLFGAVVFLAGIGWLFKNEGDTVATRAALEMGEGVCIPVASNAQIDPELEGKFVHMTGMADTKDELSDPVFGVSVTGIGLARKVEIYQWVEESHTQEKKKLGGGVERTTSYSYKQEWREGLLPSANFHQPAGHENPAAAEYQSEKLQAGNVSFGAFRLTERQIEQFGPGRKLAFATNYVCPVARAVVRGGEIYVPNAETRNNPKNVRDVAAQPRTGDMRVTFTQVLPHRVSIAAQQRGDTLVSFFVKAKGKKKDVSMLVNGERTAEEMFEGAQNANTTMCWIWRIVGILALYIGVSTILRPLVVLADVVPFIGSIVDVGVSFVAGLLALATGLLTIAVAWVFYRPVVACCLLGAVAGIVALIVTKKKSAAKARG